MMKNRPLQTIVGCLLLAVGLVFTVYHLWETRRAPVTTLDIDLKIALGLTGIGLLLLPFDLSNLLDAFKTWKGSK